MKEKNFVITEENLDSPILITVPHGGMRRKSSSWLDVFFEDRSGLKKNDKFGEVVLGGDIAIMHIVSSILKIHKFNLVVGLLPRSFVDYNRFNKKITYADVEAKISYDEYHRSIDRTIKKLLKIHSRVFLFDFHGFGAISKESRKFDIILSTNKQSSPNGIDNLLYFGFKKKYKIFCAGKDGLPEKEIFVGDTTNFHYYKKYGIDGLLVEVSPKYRSLEFSPNARKYGKILATDFAKFFKKLEASQL